MIWVPMRRALKDRRITNSVTKNVVYSYDLDGSMATLTYPSGRVITYTPNAAARLVSAVDTGNSINYATGALYAPQGALSSLANGASLVSTLYYNNRLQPCRISVKSSGTTPSSCSDTTNIGNVLDFTYNFSLGAADNGNVTAITNNRDTARSQSFTYDALNRIATAQTTATTGSKCWGETFGYDIWGNLLSIGGLSGYTGCTQENLSVGVSTKNQITNTGFSYDAAGDVLADGINGYTWDAESHLKAAAGVTYTYDGDGRRVQKSNGKLYWYGVGSDPITETDAAGNNPVEYVFFGGKRIARRDSSGTISYYFADHLGTSRVVTNASGTVLDDSDFYPFGGERAVLSSSGNNYKFTGKERDAESSLDDFGARYFSSQYGRFMSPDPVNLTWKRLVNPGNTLNKYAYAANNPLLYVDPSGQDVTVFFRQSSGAAADGGHFLLAVTNQATGQVRFADYYPKGAKGFLPAKGEMNQGVTSDRLKQHAALTIRTTPEIAQKLIDRIDVLSKQPPDFMIPFSDCVTVCADLLSLAGIEVDSILATPEDVWSQLYGDYSAEAQSGGQLKMGFYRYQPGKDFGVSMSVFPRGTDPFYNLQLLYLIANQSKKEREKIPPGEVCVSIEGGKPKCTKTQ